MEKTNSEKGRDLLKAQSKCLFLLSSLTAPTFREDCMDAKFIKNERGSTHIRLSFLICWFMQSGVREGLLPQSLPRGLQDMLVGPGRRELRALRPPVLQGFIFPVAGHGILPLEEEGSRAHGVVSRCLARKTGKQHFSPGFLPGVAAWRLLPRGCSRPEGVLKGFKGVRSE